MKIETLAVHAGYKPDPVTKAVVPPIYQTVAYAFDSAQHGADLFDLKVAGNIYTRIMNPTQSVLEERVAALEGGIAALAVASGQSAITYAIQIFTRLVNIGDVRSLATHPASTTHRQLSPEELVQSGVSEDTVRLCVGIEPIDDLKDDLNQALAAV